MRDHRNELVQYDERVGCVAVYYGEHRNCLAGIDLSAKCIFYAHGKWKRGRWHVGWWDRFRARRAYRAACARLGVEVAK